MVDSQQRLNLNTDPIARNAAVFVIAAIVGLVLLKKLSVSVSATV